MTGRRAAAVMAVTISVAAVLAACRTGGDAGGDGTGAQGTAGTAAPSTTVAATTTVAVTTTGAPVTAAGPTTTAAAVTTTTVVAAGGGPDQAQPRTAEEAGRVLDAFPAIDTSPPFDPFLVDDLDVGLRGIIAAPARTSDFFAEVASGRPVGVIAAPFLICDPDRGGGAPCNASVERYRSYMDACTRPGSVAVRRVVTTETGWAAVGVCVTEIGPEHLARAVDLVRATLATDGRPISDDPELQEFTAEWVRAHTEREARPGAPPEEADDEEFASRFRTLNGGEQGRCWRIRIDKDPFGVDGLDATSPLAAVAGTALRVGIGAGPAAGHIRVRLCAAPA